MGRKESDRENRMTRSAAATLPPRCRAFGDPLRLQSTVSDREALETTPTLQTRMLTSRDAVEHEADSRLTKLVQVGRGMNGHAAQTAAGGD